jgi:hypothetical protein
MLATGAPERHWKPQTRRVVTGCCNEHAAWPWLRYAWTSAARQPLPKFSWSRIVALATELFAGGLPPRPRSWGRTSIDWPAIDAMSGRFKTPERTRPCAKLSLRHGGNNRHGFTSSYTLFCELFRLPVTSRRPRANCGRRMQANVSTSIGKYSTCWGWAGLSATAPCGAASRGDGGGSASVHPGANLPVRLRPLCIYECSRPLANKTPEHLTAASLPLLVKPRHSCAVAFLPPCLSKSTSCLPRSFFGALPTRWRLCMLLRYWTRQ